MGVNTGKGARVGSVKSRSQFVNPRTGLSQKRNDGTGRIMAIKKTGGSFKGVAHEKDGRKR
jgi:hypothetical protein